MNTIDILIIGVGGQGTLLTSRILGALATRMGYDVKVSEVHGMAQRGGSVVTYVRMGQSVHSPIIETQGADYMLAFEKLEALRAVHMVKKGGHIIVNQQQIDPMPVIMGAVQYPDEILQRLQETDAHIHPVDALNRAIKIGNARVVNTLMLGYMAKLMDISDEIWMEVIADCVPPKTVEINQAAFMQGKNS